MAKPDKPDKDRFDKDKIAQGKIKEKVDARRPRNKSVFQWHGEHAGLESKRPTTSSGERTDATGRP